MGLQVKDKEDPVTPSEAVRLPRVLGVVSMTAYIVCVVIGSGIFVSPKGVLEQTQSTGMAMIMWFVTGVVNIGISLCYIELALTFPKAGSDYTYIKEGFGELPAFLYIWVVVVFMEGCGKAIGALTFSIYFCQVFFPNCNAPESLQKLVACLAMSGLVAMHCYSSKWAVKTSNVSTAMKLIGVGVVIASGAVYLASGNTENLEPSTMMQHSSTSPGRYALAFYAAFWAFGGTQVCMNIVEEIREPVERNLIISVVASQVVILLVNLLANLAYISVLSPLEILTSDAVAMTLSRKVLTGLFWLMPFFVACSTFGNLNNAIMNASRTILAAARHGQLPRPLTLLNVKHFTPIPILILDLALTIFFLVTINIYKLIVYVSYNFVLASFLSLVVLVKLRLTKPNLARPLKLPFAIPAMMCLVLVLLLILPFYQDPLASGMSLVMIASGVPVFFLMRLESKPDILYRIDKWVTHSIQKLFLVMPEEPANKQSLS